MAATASGVRVGARLARRWRRVRGLVRRRILPSDGLALLGLVLVAAMLSLGSIAWPRWVPLAALTVPLYLGGLLLTVRSLGLAFLAVAAFTGLAYWVRSAPERSSVDPGVFPLLAVTAALVLILARSRSRLGVAGTRGESMLVDLRDRLRAQGELPPLPPGWGAEVVLRSAYGAQFSGDFVVASRSTDGRLVEVALVDVSGKGVDAGTRALLLSGAFGGLLGAMPREQFLPACNAYLLRQAWPEGFATAVHLVVDVTTGDYTVLSAGHPPAVQFDAGSGRWRVIDTPQGPLLGVIEGAEYSGESGRLGRGDALLLYSDGLVEIPGQDLSVGIDRLLGQAERLVTGGFRDGARRLVDAVANGHSDDRALVLIWRQ